MTKNTFAFFRRRFSSVFLGLLSVSFVLWYIAKLNHPYTTELPFTVNVDGQRFRVECQVAGMGTNLFGYRVTMNKRLKIPLDELRYRRSRDPEHKGYLRLDSLSLRTAISTRLSDISVISIGEYPEIPDPRIPQNL